MAGKMVTAETVLEGKAIAVADVYVEALLGLVTDDGHAEELAGELQGLASVLTDLEGAGEMLGAATSDMGQTAWFQRVVAGRCSQTLEALLAVMARKGRLRLLPLVARRFRVALDARRGRKEVTVVTARTLGERQRRALTETLRGVTGAEPVLRTRVDPSLLGGVRVRVGDREYDASLAGQLKRLRGRLRAAARRGGPLSGEPNDHEAQS